MVAVYSVASVKVIDSAPSIDWSLINAPPSTSVSGADNTTRYTTSGTGIFAATQTKECEMNGTLVRWHIDTHFSDCGANCNCNCDCLTNCG